MAATAAIYARYSSEEQRATSIEDQTRRCREKAAEAGYEVPEHLVFSDSAVTGTEKGLSKREGYKKLLEAWKDGEFQAVIVDEPSRLFRDMLEAAKLEQLIEKSGVRLLTADGIDSTTPHWQLTFNVKSAIDAYHAREMKHRVIRGMQGQLERGYMIADAPFGYDARRNLDEKGESRGTHWFINDKEAAIVRDMFAQRKMGKSYCLIARDLNIKGIIPPRKARDGSNGYWRPGSVRRIFSNPIYRGVFVWNGSINIKLKARKENRPVKEVEYSREHLRLVDDATWFACNPRNGCVIRGGRKHAFAGFVSCGICGSKLTVGSGVPSRAVHCGQCEQARRVGGPQAFHGYVSTDAVRCTVMHAVRKAFTGPLEDEFHSRLRKLLSGDRSSEVAEIKRRLSQAEASCERYARVLGELSEDSPALEERMKEAHRESVKLRKRLDDMKSEKPLDAKAIERQLKVNPSKVLEEVLTSGEDAEHINALLVRLFRRFVLVERPRKFEAVFDIEIARGVAYADASGTEIFEEAPIQMRLRVTSSARRPVVWHVEEL